LLIQLNVHEAIAELNLAPKIVLCGSSAVYRSSSKEVTEKSRCLPITSYARAKYLQERVALSYSPRQHVTIARLFNVIGPFQSRRYFVPSAIDKIVRYKNREIPKVELTTLNAMRDFVYLDDVCSALALLVKQGANGEVYNVCKGEGVTIATVIDILKELLQVPELCVASKDDRARRGISYQVGSNCKLRGLGWAPRYEMRESLRRIIDAEGAW
jgi:GDP-4-dehydro-6-deoxy-D-mannose reductase